MEELEVRIRQFMSQLTDLTYRYKLELVSCSCCEGINIEPRKELESGMVYDCSINRQSMPNSEGKLRYTGPIISGNFVELQKAKPDGKV